jgi:hypothetical protein
MKSLLLSEYHQLEVVDLPVPSVKSNEVLVRVKRLHYRTNLARGRRHINRLNSSDDGTSAKANRILEVKFRWKRPGRSPRPS